MEKFNPIISLVKNDFQQTSIDANQTDATHENIIPNLWIKSKYCHKRGSNSKFPQKHGGKQQRWWLELASFNKRLDWST